MKTSATLLLGLLLALLPLLAAGCSDRTAAKSTADTYTVRARVRQVPARGSGSFYLEHEAIDDWKGRSGKVEGMSSMTMPFPLAEDLSLEGIEPEDVVEVRLEVDWEADLPVEITEIRELPRDTRLEFRAARPKP